MLLRKMLQLFWKPDPRVLLEDGFDGSAVNTNRWTITDSQTGNPHISVSGGNLVIAAPPGEGWGLTALVDKQAWNRVAGLTVEWQVTPGAANDYKQVGFTDGTVLGLGGETHSIYLLNDTVVNITVIGIQKATPLTYSAAQSLWARIVCKATGAYYYVSTDGKVTWSLIWIDSSITRSPLYAFIESYNAALTVGDCDVYLSSPKPPVISTTPSAPTLTLGSEEASGTLTVGTWYKITATEVDHFYAGCLVNDIFRATAATALDANNKVRALALSTTGSLVYLGESGQHNGIFDCAPTVSAGFHAGIVIHANNTTAPTTCMYAYIDRTGTTAYLVKIVSGTTTVMTSGAITYSAGAQPRIVSIGSSHALYYNNAQVGSTQTLDVSAYGYSCFSFQTSVSDNVGTVEANV